MSYTLHVVKKVEEMAPGSFLNYKANEFDGLLSSLNKGTCSDMSNEDIARSEILRTDLQWCLDALKGLAKGETPDEIPDADGDPVAMDWEEVRKAVGKTGMSLDEVIKMFDYLIKESDPSSDFVILWWY